jgi:hypothetical protein
LSVESVAARTPAVSPPRRRRTRLAGGRDRRFYVKASAAEAARLEELAGRRGVSVPRLLVEATLDCELAAGPVVAPSAHPAVVSELLAVGRLLGKVGVNVNQIARATNATGAVQPGAGPALEAVTRAAGRLEVLLGELGPPGRRGVGRGSG